MEYEDIATSYVEYTLENGRISVNEVAGMEDGFLSSSGTKEFHSGGWYTDDSKISKKKFKSILKQYGCTFKNNKIHISGDALVNFYDIFTFTFEEETANDLLQIDRDIASYNLLTAADATAVK